MSVVATPPSLPHQPFSEADLYRHTLAPSDSLDAPSRTQQTDDRQILHPFPVFQHRHTAHPLSALGPEPPVAGQVAPRPSTVLGSTTPPPAPLPSTVSLPDSSGEMAAETLAPAPDLPLGHTVFFPRTTVKLAPPAEPTPPQPLQTEPEAEDDNTPRRFPALQIEPEIEPMPSASGPGPSRIRAKTTSTGVPDERPSSLIGPRTKSSGPSRREVRKNQTSAAVVPSSVRMAESRSDSRNRSRPSKIRSTSGKLLAFGRDTPHIQRTFTAPEPASTSTPRSSLHVRDSSPPHMGGSDGLEAKVVLLGSQGVGKTSLILRYTKGVFSPVPAAATIGSSLHARKLVHDGVRVKLQIWDTAGQERFRSMAPIYYRGAHVCVLVYDVGDRQSFEDVRSWLEELGKTVPKETVIYIVGSKIDLEASHQRVVFPHNSRATIKSWMEPPAPAPPLSAPVPKSTFAQDYLSLPGSRGLFRSTPTNSRASTPKAEAKPLPTRSHSHSALSSLTAQSPTVPPPRSSLDLISSNKTSRGRPLSASPTSPPLRPTPILQITTDVDRDSSTSTAIRKRRISFPALQTPTAAATVTFSENVVTTATLQSPPHSRHGSSARFSISGLPSLSGALGYGRAAAQVGGAAFNLARLAEEFPRTPKSATFIEPPVATSLSSRSQSFGGETPSPRLRTESSPMLDNRRRSEDWSSRSWRMGEGPSAAEALGEFGDVVKRKQSGDLLHSSNSLSKGRARGISLGHDSRVYPNYDGDESDHDEDWGVDVAGMRVGDVSALTGEGVEALFNSISALLVRRREKIERERTLRKKNSVVLTDPTADSKNPKGISRSCCV